MRAATLALLAEKGPTGITIAEVSDRAKVSVGTIYGRVGNRANLLRVVQEEELARIVRSMAEHLEELRAGGENSVSGVIRAFVSEMEVSSQSIRALVAAAQEMGGLSEAGPASWRAVRDLVAAGLRGAEDAPFRAISDATMEWIYEVIDACTMHHLESDPQPKSAEATERLIKQLTRTAHLLLIADEDE
ncbi:TetR/AcrR family transcriptional regulator [Microbacterium sp. F51-2R]|uniref:TetR/AcrR family transcriptional regulator n=1 Tax=Microbacterium sp. F51-2R TaxID=3445777 RepID=UPI003FA18FCB